MKFGEGKEILSVRLIDHSMAIIRALGMTSENTAPFKELIVECDEEGNCRIITYSDLERKKPSRMIPLRNVKFEERGE